VNDEIKNDLIGCLIQFIFLIFAFAVIVGVIKLTKPYLSLPEADKVQMEQEVSNG
jgi:hypothetical protein